MKRRSSKKRDLLAEIRELDVRRPEQTPYDRRTRLGGRFSLVYPFLVACALGLIYFYLR